MRLDEKLKRKPTSQVFLGNLLNISHDLNRFFKQDMLLQVHECYKISRPRGGRKLQHLYFLNKDVLALGQ